MDVSVETSVWSFVFAEDAPEYRAQMLDFFARCRGGLVQPVISGVVLAELSRCEEPLRADLLSVVKENDPILLQDSDEAVRLAEAFLQQQVVPEGKPEDAQHVAYAFVGEVDVLVSWDFRHIANVRRAHRFNAVAQLEGYTRRLDIVSPAEVL